MEPTAQDLIKPEFEAIWNAIKKWDLERNEGEGYAGATGTDVMAILDSIKDIMIPAHGVGLAIKCFSCGKTIHVNKPITGPLRCVCKTYVVQICNESDRYPEST